MGKSSKKSGSKHKKHNRRHSSSSSSSTKSEDQWQEVTPTEPSNTAIPLGIVKGPTMPTQADLQQLEKEQSAPVTFALEPSDFDSIGSYQRENKQAVKKAQSTAEMEAIMGERELNPTLRRQANDNDDSKRAKVGDAGLEWHRRAFERCKQQAKEEQRSLNEIVSERYGSMEKLMALINDAEDLDRDHDRHHHHSSHKKTFLHPNERRDDRNRHRHHHHHHHHHHHEKKSWKRAADDDESSISKRQPRSEDVEEKVRERNADDDEVEERQQQSTSTAAKSEENDMMSEENLLELRKQLIRAELAGDDEMIELLRSEIKNIDQLRGNPQHESGAEQQQRSNDPKLLVMTTIDRYGVEKPLHNAHEPGNQRRYGHVDKRDRRKMKREIKKMRQNDKDPEREGLSLNDLVEMERHSTTNSMPVLPSNRSNPSVSSDRQILASTRHLSGWSRIQALAEQKKRQQTFEQCWLCIENLSKSFIFGLMDQWFLCAPPQQSLVDGHCFIVPIQHSSSRFHLDDDVLDELDSLKQQLTDLYRQYHNQLPIFIETFKNPRLLPHMYIECIPVPIDQVNLVPMYFRKALLESESMWSTNKKLIELNHPRSRTLKNVLPKGLPYFCVEFPVDKSKNDSVYGYAHMIEERGQFPLYFGREILGGLMQLDNPLLWMRPASKEPEDIVENKCTYLKQLWKKNSSKSLT
ncbi:unnamed protein product [Adineta ricciae]|uniref:CWF19-like protein 2 n=1 Tax=Adineta ricciae TaxID=249248 RepID=A0A814GW27_ADIRI|nr:unnamed protein product [Adineta ricciae]CAF1014035.1 unnamed protein product [Adineta ricciae]